MLWECKGSGMDVPIAHCRSAPHVEWIPGITELAVNTVGQCHSCRVLSNDLGKVQNGPLWDGEVYTNAISGFLNCLMWHLVALEAEWILYKWELNILQTPNHTFHLPTTVLLPCPTIIFSSERENWDTSSKRVASTCSVFKWPPRVWIKTFTLLEYNTFLGEPRVLITRLVSKPLMICGETVIGWSNRCKVITNSRTGKVIQSQGDFDLLFWVTRSLAVCHVPSLLGQPHVSPLC